MQLAGYAACTACNFTAHSTDMSTITVACAGAGYFSQFHYDGWRRLDSVEVVGAMDTDQSAAASTGYQVFHDLDSMLVQTRPRVLDIITPPSTHLDFIRTAIKRNISTIICQKPFCTSIEDAQTAARLCSESQTLLVIHENFRFQPWYRCIRQAIDSGTVGALHQITFRLRTGDGQGESAYLDRQPYFQQMPRFLIHETGVHWIDTFRFLMGRPIAVYADLRKMNPFIKGEDAGYMLFEFDAGKRALFDGNRHLDHAAENCRTTFGECLVEGSNGTLTLLGDGSVHHRPFGSQISSVLLESKVWPGFAGDCVYRLQAHVIDALNSGTSPENTVTDYLDTLNIEASVYRSAEEHRRILL